MFIVRTFKMIKNLDKTGKLKLKKQTSYDIIAGNGRDRWYFLKLFKWICDHLTRLCKV